MFYICDEIESNIVINLYIQTGKSFVCKHHCLIARRLKTAEFSFRQ